MTNDRNVVISKNIRKFINQKGVTQKELAEAIGISPSTLSDYLNHRSNPSHGVIQRIADYFEVGKSDIDTTFKDRINSPILDVYNKLNPQRQQKVYTYAEDQLEEQNDELNENSNVYDLDECRKKKTQVNGLLSAGTGAVNYEPNSTYEVEYEGKIPKHDLCFEVSGNSMEPMFENGEIIFVEKTYDIRSGQIIAVSINGEEYVKKAYLEEDHLRLVSLNKEYEDITAGEFDDIRVIGRIIL